jgi:hypothetical protein
VNQQARAVLASVVQNAFFFFRFFMAAAVVRAMKTEPNPQPKM